METIALMGVPLDLGAQNLGVSIGPDAFRYQGIVEKLTHAGFRIHDLGNLLCRSREELEVGDTQLKYLDEILRISEASAKLSFQAIKQGEKVVSLGGDHSQCLGVISGAAIALQGNLGLIYLDAHGDMNTVETTPTGNIHGMPLSALLGFGDSRLVHVYKSKRKVNPSHMLHIGGNDFDAGELALIRKEKLVCLTLRDIISDGFRPVFAAISQLAKRVDTIWVSLDLDVIDAVYAPGVGMPNRGGLTYREIASIASYIGETCEVVGVDINEYNPLSDVEKKTAELGIELLAKILGGNYSWYTEYLGKNKLS